MKYDIRAELEPYYPEAAYLDGKLNVASPFRYEQHPSFFIDLREGSEYFGCWFDWSADDDEWARGGPVKLLSFLRNETEYETLDYLRATYGEPSADSYDDPITLAIRTLKLTDRYRRPLDHALLKPYQFRSPYLAGRGITEAVQRLCNVGYDRKSRAIVLPIYNADGSLANVKYRKVDAKLFWYIAGGRPVRELVYGIDVIYSKRIKRAAIVEAEIDAQTLMSAGIPAIATMGAHFTAAKADLIRRSPIEELVIVRDNDKAGRKWQRAIIEELRNDLAISVAAVRSKYKDANEAGTDNMTRSFARRRRLAQLKISIKGA